MLTIRNDQMQTLADASPGRPAVLPCELTWIEIHLVDAKQNPVPGQKYRIKLPDSSIKEGTLDQDGKARYDGIPAGQCMVCFPEIHGDEWAPL